MNRLRLSGPPAEHRLAVFVQFVMMVVCLSTAAAEPEPATPAADRPLRALWLGVPHADVTPDLLVERIKRHLDCEIIVRQDWQQALREPDFAAGFAAVIYSPCDPECRDVDLVTRALATAHSGVGTVLVHCAMHTFRHVPSGRNFWGCARSRTTATGRSISRPQPIRLRSSPACLQRGAPKETNSIPTTLFWMA